MSICGTKHKRFNIEASDRSDSKTSRFAPEFLSSKAECLDFGPVIYCQRKTFFNLSRNKISQSKTFPFHPKQIGETKHIDSVPKFLCQSKTV